MDPFYPLTPTADQMQHLLVTGGLYINGQRVMEGEIFSPSLHMLPGNLSVFRVGKKTYQLLRWIH